MRTTQACLLATLLLAPTAGLLGHEGGRLAELHHALEAARHAGAALDGALGACRALQDPAGPPAVVRQAVGLTLG